MPLGMYEDGLEASLYLLERHLMVNGMTGSGKTQGALVVLAGVLYRRDVAVWVIDAVKGDQTFGELAPAIDWYATTTAQANALFTLAGVGLVLTAAGTALLWVVAATGGVHIDPIVVRWPMPRPSNHQEDAY